MAVPVVMPELGESIVEGTIVRWLKSEGEMVQEDEPIVEIMTDKVNTELPAPASGILKQILAPANTTVRVGQDLALIEPVGAAADESPAAAPPPVPETIGFYAPPRDGERTEPPLPQKGVGGFTQPFRREKHEGSGGIPRTSRGLFLSPVVQKIAREHNLSEQELLSIQGTGAGGRITRADVERYLAQRAAAPQPAPAPAPQPAPAPATAAPREGEEIIPLVGMRKAIAEHLTRSYQTAVHVTTVIQVDVSRLVEFRERNKESFQQQYGVRLTYTPFFIKAAADALLEFPMLNASLMDDQIIVRHYVHREWRSRWGERRRGVDCARDTRRPQEIDHRAGTRVRGNCPACPHEKHQPCRGARRHLHPHQPRQLRRTHRHTPYQSPPNRHSGHLCHREDARRHSGYDCHPPIMHLCLSYDHRLIDGMYAGRFLQRVKRAIEEFEFFR
jgi:pyruvate/2-oxoglutarate dehydrogenase complex dihydrolipoamide acyltransferase (E2) component